MKVNQVMDFEFSNDEFEVTKSIDGFNSDISIDDSGCSCRFGLLPFLKFFVILFI